MVIKSYYYTDYEIIDAIINLHLGGRSIHLDPTYSKGSVYKKTKQPILRYDKNPIKGSKGVEKSNCEKLPIENNSIYSIMFDPPFMFGTSKSTTLKIKNNAKTRYTMFNNFDALKKMYNKSLIEFYRILKNKGFLIFKCQDFTNSSTTMTHCLVHNWAINKGFKPVDLFVRLVERRIYNKKLHQRHARKFHSYYFVFQK